MFENKLIQFTKETVYVDLMAYVDISGGFIRIVIGIRVKDRSSVGFLIAGGTNKHAPMSSRN